MRRVVFDSYGPPNVLTTVADRDPVPGAGEVLVRTAAAGVNFVDLLQRSGVYTVRFPFTPGMEGAGTVVAVGPAVTGVAEGDRVAWAGGSGSYATHCLVPAQRLVPVPDGVRLTDAAAALVHGMTAHFLVTDVVPVRAGDLCLVHAAAGGVGSLLCQLAAGRGATVIGTVSSPQKASVARAAGAAYVIDYAREDFAERVREITGGAGVDVVYDAVGRDTFEAGLSCLRPRGTFVLYGQSSGPVTSVQPQVLNARGSLFFTKPSLSHYDNDRAALLRRAGEVLGQLQAGQLRVRLFGSHPLTAAAVAHEAIESRRSTGKLVLLTDPDGTGAG